jgi:trehalose-phosphatase
MVEDKTASVSTHFRNAGEIGEFQVELEVRHAVRPFLDCVKMTKGNKIFEVAPRAWDKGRAVEWLLGVLPEAPGVAAVPLYVGDDTTDEDAFRALAGRGVTVAVGNERESSARYRLRDTDEVQAFLKKVLCLKKS